MVQGHVSPLALPTITAPAKAQVCVCECVLPGGATCQGTGVCVLPGGARSCAEDCQCCRQPWFCVSAVSVSSASTPCVIVWCPQVNVALDSRMFAESQLSFHPMTNQASTLISPSDLVKWIAATGHTSSVVDMAAGAIVH